MAFSLVVACVAWAETTKDVNRESASAVDPYAEPVEANQRGCVFNLGQVDPELLTVQERIALMEQELDESLHASTACISEQQDQATQAIGAAGGGGGGGQGSTASNASNAASRQSQEAQADPSANPATEPGERSANNGQADQGTTGAEPDKYVCDYMREEIKNSPDAKTKSENEQAARDYGCRL